MCAVQCTSRTSSLGRVHAHYTDACESTYESKLSTHFQKHLCIVHWKPNIDQNLKVSKFVKQTRDKQDIRGKNRKILEKQTKPTKWCNAIHRKLRKQDLRVKRTRRDRKRSLIDLRSISWSFAPQMSYQPATAPCVCKHPPGQMPAW